MRLKLAKLSDAEQPAILRPDHTGVAIHGGGEHSFACPYCDHTIAEDVAMEAIREVIVECNGCKKVSAFPAFTGRVLPAPIIYFPAGIYRVTDTIELPRGTYLFGRSVDRSLDRG